MSDLPIACTLTAAELLEGSSELLPGLAAQARQIVARGDGYVLRFDASGERLAQIARVIDRERSCCPFLRFQLTVESGGGPMWLEITGPPGTADLLASVLISASSDHA